MLSRFNDLEASVREQGHTIEALKVENGELCTLLTTLTTTTSPSLSSEASLVDARTTHLRQYFNMDEDALGQFLVKNWSSTSSVDRVAIFTDIAHGIDGTAKTVQDHGERTKLMEQCGLVDPP
eukprot:scaffold99990_cov39-Cyclotella_meneghiniana.AAC.4